MLLEWGVQALVAPSCGLTGVLFFCTIQIVGLNFRDGYVYEKFKMGDDIVVCLMCLGSILLVLYEKRASSGGFDDRRECSFFNEE